MLGALGLALVAVGAVALTVRGEEQARSPVPVSAELKKFRAREADRIALLVLHNRGSRPVQVERVQLESPELREVAPDQVDAVVGPGQQLDVPVRFGPVTCRDWFGSGAKQAGRGGVAVLGVRVAGERPREARLPLPQPDAYLRTVVSLDCQQEALEHAVDLRFGERWVKVGADSLRGQLVMSRRGASGRVSVDSVDGSVVFRVEPSTGRGEPLLALAPGRDHVHRTMTLRLPWCSAHLLIEAKRAYFFPTRSRVDGKYVYSTLSPERHLRAQLGELIEGCLDRQRHS